MEFIPKKKPVITPIVRTIHNYIRVILTQFETQYFRPENNYYSKSESTQRYLDQIRKIFLDPNISFSQI